MDFGVLLGADAEGRLYEMGETSTTIIHHGTSELSVRHWNGRKWQSFATFMIHEYIRLDAEIVWDIVKNKVRGSNERFERC